MSDTFPAADPSMVGGVSPAPFAYLPKPLSMFARRAARFDALAANNELAPYLAFLASLARAQQTVQDALPPQADLDRAGLERAREFGMPPLDRDAIRTDPTTLQVLRALLDEAAKIEMPAPAATALARVRDADGTVTDQMLRDVLADAIPADALAEHAFVAAAMQVQFARMAAQLDTKLLGAVHPGTCPACGGAPVASMVVGWIGAESTRYCVCSLCATMWNHVRVKCVLCDSNAAVTYREIEGGAGTIKAECCGTCHGYVKVLEERKDTAMEAFADDVASLGLDILLRDTEFRRGSFNPFLLGA
ncbi:formate dehydrogenase accessory protein FdhE [Roseiterribacter gracilis]|uniref:Protein FdhE homolog n=1 Tax=Roseiterribacter gracilis TaxID=2812848 RepID=A0A8S8XIB7_9PROT|nr:protein FdhE [Rhodospirillales bacterium TMPK1]